MAYTIGQCCLKKKNKCLYAGVLALLVWLTAITAAAGPFELTGPEVVKLDWNTRALTVADINNDGLNDLLVINNDTAKIDVLYQTKDGFPPPDRRRIIRKNRWEPVLEDAHFQKDPFLTGLMAYDLAAGDLNGDGKDDIAYTGNIVPLTVRYQGEAGDFSREWTYDHLTPLQWTSLLRITDIDDDGANELIVIGQDKLSIFETTGKHRLHLRQSYRLSDDDCYHLIIADINGDNRKDIAYFIRQAGANNLVVRFQSPAADFGPEFFINSEEDLSSLVMFNENSENPLFTGIITQSGLIKTFTLDQAADPEGTAMQVSVYPCDMTSGESARYSLGDFDGDGFPDMAVGDPGSSRILVYFGQKDHYFEAAREFPTFSGLSAIQTVRQGKGKPDLLLVVSEKESIAGLSGIKDLKTRRLNFPDTIGTAAKPVMGTALDADCKPDTDEILLIEKNDADTYELTVFSLDNGRPDDTIYSAELENVLREPRDLLIMDLNHDGKDDVVMLIPKEPARIFVQTKTGVFKEQAIDSAIRKGSMNDMSLSRIGRGDVDNDGKNELLIADTGYVRALLLDESMKLTIVDQINTANPGARLEGPQIMDVDEDGKPEMLVYVPDNMHMEVLKREDDGIFRSRRFIEMPGIDLRGTCLLTAPGSGSFPLYLGSDRFFEMEFADRAWQMTDVLPLYETDLKDVAYDSLATGDFDGNGADDLIAMDSTNHILEILSSDGESGYQSRMHFTVFDENLNFGVRRGASEEPREIVAADLSGDGKDDIALLVHDRVLIYNQ